MGKEFAPLIKKLLKCVEWTIIVLHSVMRDTEAGSGDPAFFIVPLRPL